MAVSFSDPSVHTQDEYFNRRKSNLTRGDPTNVSLNPYQNLHDYPCKESWRSGGKISKTGGFTPDKTSLKEFDRMSAILKAYPNVRYCGMTQEESNQMLFKQQMDIQMIEALNKSSFFSKLENDGEKENRKATVSTELKNPEFILSKANDRQVDIQLEDTNSIRKRWDVDTGQGVFNYEVEDGNQVKLVEDANTNYIQRRDRFMVPSQESVSGAGASAQVDILRLLERQQMEYEAMRASIPLRNKPGKTAR